MDRVSFVLRVVLRVVSLACSLYVALALSGCPLARQVEPCDATFQAAVDAWDEAGGDLPDACRDLGSEYEVWVVDSTASLACDGEPLTADGQVIGCVDTEARTLQLRENAANHLLSAEVHLWMHALADCALGDFDHAHLRAGIWASYGARSAERQAYAKAEIGGCDE